MSTTFDPILDFIRQHYGDAEQPIGLHRPKFNGNEKKYVIDAIDSTFVSSVGAYVTKFESMMCDYTGSAHAVATVNGTSALHICLLLAGVKPHDLVITQPLTFIATCNAISYAGAEPVFVDVDRDTLGLSAEKLQQFLKQECAVRNATCFHKSGRRIGACIPMHTFGHPAKIDELIAICEEYSIPLIEDAAESIGSTYRNKHTGTFGLMGTFSFNGNKTITCGGGGIIVTNDPDLAKNAKHLTTQAKVPHPWEFNHDRIGYNYRLPNLNAAMACAQMETLDSFIAEKRTLAQKYQAVLSQLNIEFIAEPANARSNYWLNAALFEDQIARDAFLKYSNERNVMTRPVWTLMPDLDPFRNCLVSDISNARKISERLVNLPSSVK